MASSRPFQSPLLHSPINEKFDILGREIGRSDGAGSHTTAYNSYGEVTSEQHSIPNATVSYSYDSLGRQAEITASSGGSVFYQTSQSYNPATGQVISATFASSATFTFGYVPGTNLESSIVTSAFTKTVTYEANRDLPSEIKYLNSGTSLFSPKFSYTYDLLGRVTTRIRDYETNTFAYNPRSEVTSAVSNTLRTYQYDDAGNRTLADGIFQHETNALNQYTSVGSNYSPTYDADGNQTSYWPAVVSDTDYAPRSIEYDAENRAVLFRDSNNSPLISCQYDAYGRRFRKNTYSGNTIVKQTCFLYAGTNLIAEFDQTDPCFPNFVLNNIFFWDPTQPIATRTLATIIYYHEEDSFSQSLYYYTHDLTKNVWNITNADGYSGDSFHYDAFGTLLQDHGADRLHFLFSNEYYDTETGLYYYLFRYYNPFDGRWLSKDPIGEAGGWNLYAFCGNNPVNTWDRYGLLASSVGTDPCTVFFIVGHNNDIVKEINKSRALISMSKYIVLSCGGDENSKIRQIADNGDILAPRISSAHLKLKASQLKKGVDLDDLDPVTKYFVEMIRKSEFASHLLNEYMGDYEDNPPRIFHIFLIAIFDIIQKEMNKMARDINCKKCCPKGVKAEIVILDSLGFGSMNKDKKSPYLSLDHLEVIHNRIIPCE